MTTTSQPVFFGRPDTLLGICEAVGRDFGFNPNWLRLAVATPVLFSPALAFGLYGALGVLVLVSRLAFPAPRKARPSATVTQIDASAPAPVEAEVREPLPLAA